MLRLHSKVELKANSQGKEGARGTVVGAGFVTRVAVVDHTLLPLHIVELDKGYYDIHGDYVSLVCVHEDNLIEL
jgi:hypothetical protein